MTERVTLGRAIAAVAARLPRLNPDLRFRNRRLIRHCRDHRPEVVVLVGGNTVILPETLRILRAAGSTIVYTCGTSPVVFAHALEREAALLYDLVVANDRYHAVQWQELGARRVEVLPMSAVDPDVHRPYDLTAGERARYACDVGFVGTLVPQRLYSERVAALESLRDLDLKIWSVHDLPPRLRSNGRGPLLGEAMVRALCAAKIVVNPHGDFMRWGGNMRLFEACGVGAFQIADDRPGIRDWFEPGRHLVTYRDPVHLRELVTFYLAHDDDREAIARAGRVHALEHHTYDHRMADLIRLVGEVRHGSGGRGPAA
jgi:spore maturation protein CgeB